MDGVSSKHTLDARMFTKGFEYFSSFRFTATPHCLQTNVPA